ncbi:hypothetical protein [Comamonas odontotermitis]|nr:hypothetical protein [Comamonas odontotermitis]
MSPIFIGIHALGSKQSPIPRTPKKPKPGGSPPADDDPSQLQI